MDISADGGYRLIMFLSWELQMAGRTLIFARNAEKGFSYNCSLSPVIEKNIHGIGLVKNIMVA